MTDPFDQARWAVEDQHERAMDQLDRQWERERQRLDERVEELREKVAEVGVERDQLQVDLDHAKEQIGDLTRALSACQGQFAEYRDGTGGRFEHWAWIITEAEGGEGVLATMIPGFHGPMPLVTRNKAMAEMWEPFAVAHSATTGEPTRLAHLREVR